MFRPKTTWDRHLGDSFGSEDFFRSINSYNVVNSVYLAMTICPLHQASPNIVFSNLILRQSATNGIGSKDKLYAVD